MKWSLSMMFWWCQKGKNTFTVYSGVGGVVHFVSAYNRGCGWCSLSRWHLAANLVCIVCEQMAWTCISSPVLSCFHRRLCVCVLRICDGILCSTWHSYHFEWSNHHFRLVIKRFSFYELTIHPFKTRFVNSTGVCSAKFQIALEWIQSTWNEWRE